MSTEPRDTKTIAGKFAETKKKGGNAMGQPSEYTKLDYGERKEYLISLIAAPGGERAAIHKAGAKAIIEMFEEVLSCLTDGIDWLQRIDDQYEERYPDEECPRPEFSFWSAIYEARQPLRGILERLEADEKDMPKEVTA